MGLATVKKNWGSGKGVQPETDAQEFLRLLGKFLNQFKGRAGLGGFLC